MWKYITSWFKDTVEDNPNKSYYPFVEMEETRTKYKNEQHEKAMKAPIKKENLDEELRRKGLL